MTPYEMLLNVSVSPKTELYLNCMYVMTLNAKNTLL